MRLTLATVFGALVLAAAPAWGDEAAFALTGPDGNLLQISAEDLQDLPVHHVHVAFQTGKGEVAADYEGVLLWDLLVRASAVPIGPPKNHVRLTVRVTGRDGWVAAVAVAEIDPDFEGKEVLLGHAVDADASGGSGGGDFRLIVPGDKHGARSVRDVASIKVQ